MATATRSRLRLAAALAAALAMAGCSAAGSTVVDRTARPDAAFRWLQPTARPAGWKVARLPSQTAALAFPPSWQAIKGDKGTVSAALLGPHRRIRGYLNVAPRSGAESLGNWARFRPAHNRGEGDRMVVRDAAAVALRFRSGSGSCVIDHYVTVAARYRELACIVRGSRATNVVVAAAQSTEWRLLAPQLKRSITSFSS